MEYREIKCFDLSDVTDVFRDLLTPDDYDEFRNEYYYGNGAMQFDVDKNSFFPYEKVISDYLINVCYCEQGEMVIIDTNN